MLPTPSILKSILIVVLLALGVAKPLEAQEPLRILRSNTTSIDVQEGTKRYRGYWTVSPKVDKDVYYAHRFTKKTVVGSFPISTRSLLRSSPVARTTSSSCSTGKIGALQRYLPSELLPAECPKTIVASTRFPFTMARTVASTSKALSMALRLCDFSSITVQTTPSYSLPLSRKG